LVDNPLATVLVDAMLFLLLNAGGAVEERSSGAGTGGSPGVILPRCVILAGEPSLTDDMSPRGCTLETLTAAGINNGDTCRASGLETRGADLSAMSPALTTPLPGREITSTVDDDIVLAGSSDCQFARTRLNGDPALFAMEPAGLRERACRCVFTGRDSSAGDESVDVMDSSLGGRGGRLGGVAAFLGSLAKPRGEALGMVEVLVGALSVRSRGRGVWG
jgi:hypothetical protein